MKILVEYMWASISEINMRYCYTDNSQAMYYIYIFV